MTEIITSLQEYIKPELFVLVPLMFGLGAALKADASPVPISPTPWP